MSHPWTSSWNASHWRSSPEHHFGFSGELCARIVLRRKFILKTFSPFIPCRYGSIVWKTGFEYAERKVCCAYGHRRRFYQGSTDHRGTPKLPGRTVTLEPAEEFVWGAAYKVEADNAAAVLELLEFREKAGHFRQNS